MIIKKIKMQNIRSYKDETIELPLGTTLFEGDIGSGKSTILMAIEFALFGLGSERGASLLRAGEHEGKVGLVFDVDGREHTVTRTLTKKGRTIQQAEGHIRAPEGTLTLSPSELKEKILEILNFNEPVDPKAQSIIYRYAIFTPQEEMKSILFMKPDMRLQTLRKAFRIEDYKTAAENAQHLSNTLKLQTTRLEAAVSDIPDIKGKIEELKMRLSQKKDALTVLREQQQQKQKTLQSLNREKEELHSAEVQLSKALADINHLEKLIHTLAEEETLSKNRVEQLQEKVTSLQRDIEELSLPTPPSKSQEMLEKEIKELEALEISLRKEEGKLSNKLEDYHHIHENGVCPTCDREAEPNEFISKIESASILRDQASRKVQECLKTLENAKDMLKERRRHDEAQRDVERLRSQEHDYNEEVQRQQEKIASYQRESTDAADRLTVAKNTERILKETSINLAALNEQIKAAEEELTVVVKEVHTAETTITNCETQIQDYETELMIKEKKRERAEILGEYQIWVDDYFIPTLNLIEKHVMLNINQDFDSRFQRWFSILIDDPGKEARIDEDFTPIVEQDGYEQEINYLSGGEKTSGALAYRLALNSIVQKVSTGMQSNLIILDEPTDGFSKEQLSKVREILDELQSPQVILVSHERELESFADQIYRVTKSDGESKVTLAS